MFTGLRAWVDALWVLKPNAETTINTNEPDNSWHQRQRPLLRTLAVVGFTHLIGAMLFVCLTGTWFVGLLVRSHLRYPFPSFMLYQDNPLLLFVTFAILPILVVRMPPSDPLLTAPPSLVLKAFTLCLASTVISIISVLNFSLAACLAVLLGIPVAFSSTSPYHTVRACKYLIYIVLALGWFVFLPNMTHEMFWNWDILGVWLAPFVCLVYTPIVLQSALVCWLP
jgi:GPI-anchor transamidase subunit GAA1